MSPLKLASVLLAYPTEAVFAGLDALEEAAAECTPRATREAFGRFLGWLRATAPAEVAEHYVDTFDLRRRCALYLTYHRYGDTRERGMAMLTFTAAYRAAGFEPRPDELPDYLPMVLDFAALSPRGERLLRGHRVDLELLLSALQRDGSPYADVVAAVCARLPGLGRRELDIFRRAWQAGPPGEQVGVEPFAPPEYLAGHTAGHPAGHPAGHTAGQPGGYAAGHTSGRPGRTGVGQRGRGPGSGVLS